MANNEISDAVNLLLQAARIGFDEPNGNPTDYRFSINGNQLECMHATRRPLEWRTWPVDISTNATTKGAA